MIRLIVVSLVIVSLLTACASQPQLVTSQGNQTQIGTAVETIVQSMTKVIVILVILAIVKTIQILTS